MAVAEPLIAGLPPDLHLSAGYIVRLVGLDPSTGATVAGITVSDVAVFVTDTGGADDGRTPLPLLVPSSTLV